ncbi:MCE family protein [Marmoricola sp. Leaf446]|uniref:MCE family protein n=1 Tax=Marmoricola sp. Leaf446 TaxID=1736379 RepID=UPI0009E95BD3|nr:MCE family protein [Marmoricola sp. Leaf446]
MKTLGKLNPIIAVILVVALVAAALALFWPGSDKRTVTADFPRTVSLYEGSDVRILGVPVGKVEKVTPVGEAVRVKLQYDAKYKLPADAKAVVVAPSIVGDRYVQLTPAYTGGDQLPDDAKLGLDRTATPLELDEIFSSINDLTVALGPEQSNRPRDNGVGPLTRLLDSTARNLGGQGVEFNKTLKNVGELTQTLSDNKDELFGSLAQVQDFTSTLAANDQTVRQFNDSLAGGANLLADERQELAAVLKSLGIAMAEVRTFIRENKGALSRNIAGLNRITKTLVKRRAALDETLQYAPGALNNLFLAGNTDTGTLDVRDNVGEIFDLLSTQPATAICALIGGGDAQKQACDALKGVLEPATGAAATSAAAPRATPFEGDPSTAPRIIEPVDRSLGGLVEVQR